MNKLLIFLFALCAAVSNAATGHARAEDTGNIEIGCGNCTKWNVALKPFKVVANTWYVGTAELSSVLVTGPKGHVLIDGALPQSVPQIEANIKALGFRLEDIKVIVNTHPHFDHAGGIAQLARDSGATVMASAAGASVLRAGVIGSDDPQFEIGGNTHFPRVDKVRVVGDGEVIAVGPLKLTAHKTPGHTPGGASYTRQSCSGKSCVDVAFVDSLNPASSDGFYYSGDAKRPNIVPSFEASIGKVASLKCDVVLSAHPDFTDMLEKLAARTKAHNTFIDGNGCKAYAADASARLSKRLGIERQKKAAGAR
ncbi:MAG: subclass metallo-beta-lactamase [Capsulimonas sp.]|nr:subclass metallo-beta-lactamase [Capsulimonas sp.]